MEIILMMMCEFESFKELEIAYAAVHEHLTSDTDLADVPFAHDTLARVEAFWEDSREQMSADGFSIVDAIEVLADTDAGEMLDEGIEHVRL